MQSSSQIVATSKLTPSFLQARCPSGRPTNNVKALKVNELHCLPLTYYYVCFNFTLPRGQALFTQSIVEVQCTSKCHRIYRIIYEFVLSKAKSLVFLPIPFYRINTILTAIKSERKCGSASTVIETSS